MSTRLAFPPRQLTNGATTTSRIVGVEHVETDSRGVAHYTALLGWAGGATAAGVFDPRYQAIVTPQLLGDWRVTVTAYPAHETPQAVAGFRRRVSNAHRAAEHGVS